ncbi:MBL fold metallo-hydrolase [Marinomonas agarivorans]|nr:MBL fold metallo-hydrolase [Marinomonas agarivorans]
MKGVNLEYTFIGHQSWLIEEGNTKILLDPLLEDTFGFDQRYGIEVVPPRIVGEGIYKDIDAILLSHEHSDHFHLHSLNKISRKTPVYVGCLTIQPLIDAVEKLGFTVHKLKSREKIIIGGLEISAYQAHPKTVLWESRVYQFLFRSFKNNYSLFIAVDALISKDFEQDIYNKDIPQPDSILISNNSQIPPKGVTGSLDNLKIPENENRARMGALGLRLVKGIIINYSDLVHDLEHIILCGGGFMKTGDTFGEFMMSNQGKVAQLAAPLFPDKKIDGAVPGMVFRNGELLEERSINISENIERSIALKEKFLNFLQCPEWNLKAVSESSLFSFQECCEKILSEVLSKHHQIMASEFGRILVSTGNPNECFALTLIDGNTKLEKNFSYNWKTNNWKEIGNVENIPFGIRAIALDFFYVVIGKIQIWDIAGLAVSSWYDPVLGNNPIKYSPMGFIYSLFGEHFNTNHFEKLCNEQIKEISIV